MVFTAGSITCFTRATSLQGTLDTLRALRAFVVTAEEVIALRRLPVSPWGSAEAWLRPPLASSGARRAKPGGKGRRAGTLQNAEQHRASV